MSAKLKLKKLKTELKFVRDYCRSREAEVYAKELRCFRLLHENTRTIEARTELHPVDTMRGAIECLEYNIYALSIAITREYTKQLNEYIHKQLTSKYRLDKFSTVRVQLIAPALTEDHVKIDVR